MKISIRKAQLSHQLRRTKNNSLQSLDLIKQPHSFLSLIFSRVQYLKFNMSNTMYRKHNLFKENLTNLKSSSGKITASKIAQNVTHL